jgi:hypothetical protein
MNSPDHISESLETILWIKILEFFDADPGTGMEKIRIRDKHLGAGSRFNKSGSAPPVGDCKSESAILMGDC